MELPKRKSPRIPGYDYSTNGAYFITICTKDKKPIFGPVGADMESAPTISQIVRDFKRYSTVCYIALVKNGDIPPFEEKIWQRSFHDHVIRDEKGYLKIWNYIEGNPSKWEEDCFYVKEG